MAILTGMKRKLQNPKSGQATTFVEISIGTGGGRDYSTFGLFEAALDDSNHFPKGSDVIAICYDDSIFQEALDLDHRPFGFNSLQIMSGDGKWDDQDWEASDGLKMTRSIRFKN